MLDFSTQSHEVNDVAPASKHSMDVVARGGDLFGEQVTLGRQARENCPHCPL
jgi:hypothetical protein